MGSVGIAAIEGGSVNFTIAGVRNEGKFTGGEFTSGVSIDTGIAFGGHLDLLEVGQGEEDINEVASADTKAQACLFFYVGGCGSYSPVSGWKGSAGIGFGASATISAEASIHPLQVLKSAYSWAASQPISSNGGNYANSTPATISSSNAGIYATNANKMNASISASPIKSSGGISSSPSGGAGGSSYTIKSGDTLSAIAARSGTTVAALASANGISNPNNIRAGASITVPSKPSTGSSSSGKASTGKK